MMDYNDYDDGTSACEDGKFSRSELKSFGVQFLSRYLHRVNQTNMPSKENLLAGGDVSLLRDECGFEVLQQILYASYQDMIVRLKRSTSAKNKDQDGKGAATLMVNSLVEEEKPKFILLADDDSKRKTMSKSSRIADTHALIRDEMPDESVLDLMISAAKKSSVDVRVKHRINQVRKVRNKDVQIHERRQSLSR